MRGRHSDPGDLARFADGRVWRLKRGRDFAGSPRAFRRSLGAFADGLGKVVVVAADRYRPDRFVWVQFGEGTVAEGARCECGSGNLFRLHRQWARCGDCGRLLKLVEGGGTVLAVDEPVPPDGPAPGAARVPSTKKRAKTLDDVSDVELYRLSIGDDVEQCFGYGVRPDGREVLLSVAFPLEDGRRIPNDEVPGQWLYELSMVRREFYDGLAESADLESGVRVSWKTDEDRGPQPDRELEGPAPG